MIESRPNDNENPLQDLDHWEDFIKTRYPEESASEPAFNPTDPNKKNEAFRDYEKEARSSVKEFYRLNHTHQTFDFVQQKKAEYFPKTKRKMSIWQAQEFLNTLVDDSDPDTDLPQMDHALQTAEAIRKAKHPRWMILTGFIHDLGKVLCLYGEPQWAVVGDTFPVGCRFSDKIVFPEFFARNPDAQVPEYQTEIGIYSNGIGLDNVHMSWGHDEYLYHVVKAHLPEEALYVIRYHSCYPIHRESAYDHLMNDRDREMFAWVRKFNPFDLYTKSHEPPDREKLMPFYEDLVAEFFPPLVDW
jgi:inositol oxygenase